MGLLLGVDGGGSSSRLRAIDTETDGIVERQAGPLNPTTSAAWADELDALLAGLTSTRSAALCVAGMRSPACRARVEAHARAHLPDARLRLEPDYVAALACFDPPVTVCVVAGTGSIVCSKSRGGAIVTSGGEGPAVGDRGSAFRLGERALAMTGGFAATPAAIAAHAPALTAAAERGDPAARAHVDDELSALAEITCAHVDAHHDRTVGVDVGIVGSVWSSPIAVASFTTAVRRLLSPRAVRIRRANRRPVDAALQLALEGA